MTPKPLTLEVVAQVDEQALAEFQPGKSTSDSMADLRAGILQAVGMLPFLRELEVTFLRGDEVVQ